MMTLDSFYDLISRNARVTLVNARSRANLYIGSVRDIPDEYSICPVEDFSMDDKAHLTFKIRVPRKRLQDNNWKEGALRVPDGGIYHYWVKAYETGSEFGIDGGRISKLTLERKGQTVCNYDRGWDVQPVDEETQIALEILLQQYN